MKVEQVSYDVMTPSAARGVLEAVYWKPQIRWLITAIHVLAPVRFTSIRRNGVGSKVPVKGASGVQAAMQAGSGRLGLHIESDRQQTASTYLRDVHYVIDARFEQRHDDTDAPGKHLDIFNRRAERGQCFHRPYLGAREHDCQFARLDPAVRVPAPSEPLPTDWRTGVAAIDDADRTPLAGERDLGYMLYDIDFRNDRTPHFFRAVLRDGSLRDLDQEMGRTFA